VSEYQYYEFAALDHALDRRQQSELRAISTRALITPTGFVNTYEWGDLKADPRRLVERYFDAFLYLANWGTHRLMLRYRPRRWTRTSLHSTAWVTRRRCGPAAST